MNNKVNIAIVDSKFLLTVASNTVELDYLEFEDLLDRLNEVEEEFIFGQACEEE